MLTPVPTHVAKVLLGIGVIRCVEGEDLGVVVKIEHRHYFGAQLGELLLQLVHPHVLES